MTGHPSILLTGATGYIGGRLLPVLQQRGFPVRCFARHPDFLRGRVAAGTEIVPGDVMEPRTLDAAMAGIHTAYFLVHSMGAAGRFETMDRLATEHFATAARKAGLARIIYLGALGEKRLGTFDSSPEPPGGRGGPPPPCRRHPGGAECGPSIIVFGQGSPSPA